MITFSQLGNYGLMSNQLFQYAALYGTGFIRGYKIAIPENAPITKYFELHSSEKLQDFDQRFPVYKEQNFNFDPTLWMIKDNSDVLGYFQSPGYWNHCHENVIKEFQFKKEIVEKADSWIEKNIDKNVPICSIHVRRGDYVKLSETHYNLPIAWYQQAVNIMEDQIKNPKQFLIFSDDPEWCREKFKGAKVVEGNSGPIDMCIMSRANMHIIANSTFSWWAATLSGSRAVIAPKQWFGPKGPSNWDSIYMKEWLKL